MGGRMDGRMDEWMAGWIKEGRGEEKKTHMQLFIDSTGHIN